MQPGETESRVRLNPSYADKNESCVTVAVDFGTSYTGFAFSFKGTPDVITTQTHGGKLPADRVPTVILLNPDQTFNSFGCDAIETYSDLSEEERPDYFYFEHFKMFLYETLRGETRENELTLKLRAMTDMGLRDLDELNQLPCDWLPEYLRKYYGSRKHTTKSYSLRIKDILNREIDAQKIFSLSIKYFRDLAVESVDLSTQGLKEEYIQWMISIPAIWSDSARQFMRQAAKDAGIRPENLRLVLEPEAASLYCEEHAVVASGNTLNRLPVGHKYILADLGGGTVDICVHEVVGEGKLRELYRATGGDFGGNTVNKEFEIFMSTIVGHEIWKEFKISNSAYYNDFMKCFENKKREFRMDTKTVTFRLESSLVSLCETRFNDTFTSIVSKCKHGTSIKYKTNTGKLSMDRSVFQELFDNSLFGIIEKLNHILQSCKTDNITTLMLVGGYAESHYARERIRAACPSLKVMLPSDSRLAVLKGAVMMGYQPRDVVERRAQFTYGFDSRKVFNPSAHPERLRLINDGVECCVGVFKKMIEQNQVVKYGDTFKWDAHSTAVNIDTKDMERHTQLWRSCNPNPRYCLDNEGSDLLGIEDQACEEVGEIIMKPPHEGWPDYWDFETQLIAGETDLIVRYINKSTGKVFEENMNFF